MKQLLYKLGASVLRISILTIILLAITNFVVTACTTTPYEPELLDRKYDVYNQGVQGRMPSIIRLHDSEGRFFCTGFVIDDNYALTAGHCVVNRFNMLKSDLKIYNKYGYDTGVIAQPAGAGSRIDWGILRGDFSLFKKARIETDQINYHENRAVLSCGFPYGKNKIFCTSFRVSGTHFFSIKGKSHLYPGMSGGPVIDMETKKVIGINSYVTEDSSAFAPLIGILSYFGIE